MRPQAEKAVRELLAKAHSSAPGATAWEATLRQLTDAVVSIYQHPEDCDECSALSETGDDSPCTVHRSNVLFDALMASFEVLGPCVCGHPCSQHENEDTTRCKYCDCAMFKLPPPPASPEEE